MRGFFYGGEGRGTITDAVGYSPEGDTVLEAIPSKTKGYLGGLRKHLCLTPSQPGLVTKLSLHSSAKSL